MAEIYSLLKRKLIPKNKKNPATKPTIAGRAKLTPTPSSENLSNGSSASPFFTVLSPELRNMILTKAFGNRIIHLHHSYFELLKSGKFVLRPQPRPGQHTKINHSRRKMRKSGYYWTSSVCHRINPYTLESSGDPGPANDSCHWEKYSPHCDAWPGDVPEKCLIGAMGFLLTCKQAYVEGIEVLFATNTLHMGEAYLLGRLETLLLPQRLARIRSVELTWQLQPAEFTEKAYEQQSVAGATLFREMVASLPRALPNLRKLTLAVNDRFRALGGFPRDGDERQWGEQVLLGPVDETVRRFKQLEHVELAIPATYYLGLYPETTEAEWTMWRFMLNRVRTWRPLDGAPDDGSTTMAETAVSRGYWVVVGEVDLPISIQCF